MDSGKGLSKFEAISDNVSHKHVLHGCLSRRSETKLFSKPGPHIGAQHPTVSIFGRRLGIVDTSRRPNFQERHNRHDDTEDQQFWKLESAREPL